jgi:hypothetical protein
VGCGRSEYKLVTWRRGGCFSPHDSAVGFGAAVVAVLGWPVLDAPCLQYRGTSMVSW